LFLEGDLPSSIHSQQHFSVKSEFGYFVDRPTLVHSSATADRQFKKQHRVPNAEDGAINVAVNVLKKS
jgi:hypothetical protein